MTLDDINKLDLKTLADWPLPTKLAALGLLCVAIVAAGWWFDWRGGMETLDAAKQKETELRSVFTTKKNQAINLDAYKKQLADIEQAFGALLKQLPNKQEMDALITDVNQAGLGRGLQFDLFKPEAETVSEFYAETPITRQSHAAATMTWRPSSATSPSCRASSPCRTSPWSRPRMVC